VPLVFVFADAERGLSDDDARWLISELRAADEEGAALARRLQEAESTGEAVETTLAEKRTLLQVFERSTRARGLPLRSVEVALHEAIFRSS
jgi:hypothetical protein